MLLPDTNVSGLARKPWLYQEFTMPDWLIAPTATGGAQLKLSLNVGVNPEGANQPSEPEPLFVSLRDATGSITVTTPITLATDANTPTLNPLQPNNNDWLVKQFDLADSFSPAEEILDYRSQTMQLYFNAPNPYGGDANSTRFYLDNVAFEICNIEPRPNTYSTLVSGEVRVLIDGIPTPKPGIFVWVYAIDGQMEKSYTIQDSTFSFYDLPATTQGTTYILYAEYFEDGNFYSASTILLLKPAQKIEDISLILF
jgi:hypothetical protein